MGPPGVTEPQLATYHGRERSVMCSCAGVAQHVRQGRLMCSRCSGALSLFWPPPTRPDRFVEDHRTVGPLNRTGDDPPKPSAWSAATQHTGHFLLLTPPRKAVK